MRWRKSYEPAATSPEVGLAPDYAEPLRAWRLWEVEDVDQLPAYAASTGSASGPWEPRSRRGARRSGFACSRRPRHAAPSGTCTCGIYGAPFELIRRTLAIDSGLPPWPPFVIGTVSLWGDVLECERGWRAALAYPSRLFVPLGLSGAAERAVGLRDYGVPVDLLETSTIADALDDVAELAA